ncbi:hypothetical protein HMPREF3045_07655 [Anaerococcus sp. HMSC075B03]|uniref:hypothetical protein n=1 Tax=Anaerococcus sp. HMSC075B03 TaxID=1739537 RepID=UPI0008A3C0C6|nr:hypothetical protein [Anaerococcus sp. HMSC075B03]OFO43654.1 hypothetical protein HMPREF3045_07655 [Anaerococcus sp. HMSC075B03]
MIYEPENLKNKRAIYEKRDKWLIRLALLFWAVLLFIYVNIAPYVKSTIGFLGVIVGGIAVISIVYFFTVFFVLMLRGRQFRKMNNDIVKEYQENKNGEIFLEKLLAMDMKPKDMKDEMIWYLNIATAFNVLGKRNECIALFKQLEEVATEKEKEYIQNSIKFVQEQSEKDDTH